MKKNSYFSLVAILFFGLITQAQSKKWTLEECVKYALENNISIKQSELDTQTATIDKKSALGNFLPSINATTNHSWNIGLNQDITTGLLRNQTTQFTSTGMNVGIDIPAVESTTCNYDEAKNEKSVYFKFDDEVNIKEYCNANKFSKLQTINLEEYLDLNYVGNSQPFNEGIDNFYFKKETRYSNNYQAILNPDTKELWIVISFKD